MEELKQKLESLEARAIKLEQEIDNEPEKDVKLVKLAAATALNNRIAALDNRITEERKSRGNFIFLRVEFYFLLEFVALNFYLRVGHCNDYISVSVMILHPDIYFIRVDNFAWNFISPTI